MKIKKTLKWIFGIIFLLLGLQNLLLNQLTSVLSILLGLFLLPPTYYLLEKSMRYKFKTTLKWVITLVFLFALGASLGNDKKVCDSHVDLLVDTAVSTIEKGELEEGVKLLEVAKGKYSNKSENKAVKLLNEVEKANSNEYAKKVLLSMNDLEYQDLVTDRSKKKYFSIKYVNNTFVTLLKLNSGEREKVIEKNRLQKSRLQEKKNLEARLEKRERRIQEIERQFSSWDGAHRELTRLIKKSLRDPGSYEHIETKYIDRGNEIYVITKYRAKNGFGGMSIGVVEALVDFEGNVINTISEKTM